MTEKSLSIDDGMYAKMEALAPTPIYGCMEDWCAPEVSYPADMLHWDTKTGGWRCWECFVHQDKLDDAGIALSEFFEMRNRRAENT